MDVNQQFSEEQVRAIFTLADIKVLRVWQTVNCYRSVLNLQDAEWHLKDPWWLVKTHAGLIHIGWRKRVISIDWSDTPIRAIVTKDDVTKDEHMVHAWSEEKAIEYLKSLKEAGVCSSQLAKT